MMNQYVTLGDLLEIGGILLNLATFIAYIYYNHKNSKHEDHQESKKD